MSAWTEIARGLQFPEGPVAMPDGSVLVVEIRRGTLTRVAADGGTSVVAELGGGPNGAAIGPDGRCYVCNNGGFEWHEADGLTHVAGTARDYVSGSIQAVDLGTGAVETLYTECDGLPLNGPNDLAFDSTGGFWFTDLGKTHARRSDIGAVHYARPDGSSIRREIFPMFSPNGVGLSPDETTLYVAETWTGRLWAFPLAEPGRLAAPHDPLDASRLLHGAPGLQLFDSLAVDSAGNVCVATLVNGGITVIPPDGAGVRHVPLPDPYTTNVCFGAAERRTAYVTLSGTGRLVALEWECPGLALPCGGV
jgi:gluconolactonase